MAKPQYATRRHRALRAKLGAEVQAGRAWCAEPVCKVEQQGGSRWIPPGSRWHLSHDPSGTQYIGPSHEACNSSEGATRGNRMRARARTHRRRVL